MKRIRHPDSVGFIPGGQRWFNIRKLVISIYYIIKKGGKFISYQLMQKK
jgi:hypothetical protein